VAITSGWSNVRRAFAHRHYRTYQTGRFVSQITVWMYKVAIGWMVWKLTHSAAWLGVFGLLDQLPALFILPVAGALADRLDSLKVMRVTQAILLVQAVSLSLLDAFDLLTLWNLIVFALVYGLVNAAQQPAGQAILPNLLDRHELATAYGLNSLTFNVSRFIGPMLAGIIINAWGTAPAIFCNAIGATFFSIALMRMQTLFTFPKRPRSASSAVFRDIREGFRYARRHPGIGPTMAIMSSLSILPFTIDLLLPSLADGVFHAGAQGLAWMTSMMGVGAMAQAAVMARRGGVAGLSAYFFRGILGLGATFLLLSVSPALWMALICIFSIGFTSSATRVSSMTLLQYSVDADMRGRVASFYAMINQTGPALASLFVGVLGDHIGLKLTMGLIGVWTLAAWALGVSHKAAMRDSLEKDVHPAPASDSRKPRGAAKTDAA
jgi:MFS family permease